MKKTALLNQQMSHVISGMGHLDMLVISDAGLPIPDSTERVDLALTKGIPDLLSVLEMVLSELEVEKMIIAKELQKTNPVYFQKLIEFFDEKVEIQQITHIEFKTMCHDARAIIRTGEFTPYANIILVSGVVF